jgi:UDP-N-acetylmuramyl pentapeptide synthase
VAKATKAAEAATVAKASKVAVLDTIHGGRTIAQRMVECGLKAEALEVYHHCPNIESFDLVVAPVHLPPGNPVLARAKLLGKKVITHHQAVGELMAQNERMARKLSQDLRIFEITGTHSKTSTALLLARVLSSKEKVVSHTTRGIEIWSEGSSLMLRQGLSITPANVIPALAEAENQGADTLISEVSLGGTGLADFGILTSFSGNYRIAGGTKWASTAKLQMVSRSKEGFRLMANTDVCISPDISFGSGGQIRFDPDKIYFKNSDMHLELGEDLDFPSYKTALEAASAAAHAAGMRLQEIASALEGFDGFSGRMKITRLQGLIIFDSSNSGLKVPDIKKALDKAAGDGLMLVVGEEAETVCEGMDIPGLVELLRQRRKEIDDLVLVGKRLEPWAEMLEARIAQDLEAGRVMAMEEGANRLLLCVKCFR